MKIPRRKRAHFVSPNTQSIVLKEGTNTLGVFDTTPSSNGCASASGSTLCRFLVGIAPGTKETFEVTAFDATGGGGNQLAVGSVTQDVSPGLNVIAITMGGVVASVAVSLAVNGGIPAGSATSVRVTVMAKDADGNVIIAPGGYHPAITLTDSDTTGTTAISVNGSQPAQSAIVKSPGQDVTIRYNGNSLTSFSITPSATGVSTVSPFTAFLKPVLTYTILPSTDGMNAGAIQAGWITKGSDGNLWFIFTQNVHGSGSGGTTGIATMSGSGAIKFFIPGVPPSTNLPSSAGYLKGAPQGSAIAAWFLASAGSSAGTITPSGAVALYPLNPCGGGSRNIAEPAVDAAGGLWVGFSCSSGGDQLIHVDSSGNVTASPRLTGFEQSAGLCVGKDGNVYVAGEDTASQKPAILQVVVSGGSVVSFSSAIYQLPEPHVSFPSWENIAQTADGDFWITRPFSTPAGPSDIVRLHPAATFSTSTYSLYSTTQGGASPYWMVPLPDGTLWVLDGQFPALNQVVPSANEGTPVINTFPVPDAFPSDGVLGNGAVGSDGNIYIAEQTYSYTNAGAIVKLAY